MTQIIADMTNGPVKTRLFARMSLRLGSELVPNIVASN
jgi:hypothetical protein